jgi:hypothetical protein
MNGPMDGSSDDIFVSEKKSSWWYWGPAVGIILFVISTTFGTFIASIIPYGSAMSYYPEPQQPGQYPENGSTEEQSQWNNSNKEYADWNLTNNIVDSIIDSRIQEKQIWVGTLLVATAIPVIALLLAKHPWSFRATAIWIFFKSILESYLSMQVQYMIEDILIMIPELNQYLAPPWVYSISGIFQIICCNLLLLSIIVVCSMTTANSEIVPPSGFHIDYDINRKLK